MRFTDRTDYVLPDYARHPDAVLVKLTSTSRKPSWRWLRGRSSRPSQATIVLTVMRWSPQHEVRR